MEWIERLENTLEYIETHLTEEISTKEIARIAYCSEYHYQLKYILNQRHHQES